MDNYQTVRISKPVLDLVRWGAKFIEVQALLENRMLIPPDSHDSEAPEPGIVLSEVGSELIANLLNNGTFLA